MSTGKEEIAKVQKTNQTYHNRRARERRLNIGDSVLLLLSTENNKLTLAWRGLYKVVERVGEVDYRIRITVQYIKGSDNRTTLKIGEGVSALFLNIQMEF